MEDFNRQLKLTDENGVPVTINVLDIIDENPYNKEFIIYTLEGDDETVFASILNEREDSYSLDTIEKNEEIDYINTYLDNLEKE